MCSNAIREDLKNICVDSVHKKGGGGVSGPSPHINIY